MNIKRQRGLLAAASAVALWACGGGSDGPPAPAKVATVVVTSPASQIEIGATVSLSYQAFDAKGNALTGRTVAWASSSPSVATVDNGGVVSGASAGTAAISAAVEGVTGSAQITVIPTPVASVLISPRTPAVKQGESTRLTAIAQDVVGRTLSGRTITWSSQNPVTATVDGTGLVSGVASGSTYIIAASEGKRDSVSLRVRSLSTPTVATTTPAQWTPGIAATITGANFSVSAAENEVYVNGVRAAVTAATTTTLSITVPTATALPCSPTGPIGIAVVVNGDSAIGSVNLSVATPRTLAVGQHLMFTAAAELACNEFSTTGGRYLVTAFNSSTSSATRTSFQLLGAATTQASAQNVLSALPPATLPTQGPLVGALRASNDEAFARGHLAVLQQNALLAARSRHMRQALLNRRARARQGLDGVSPLAREVFAGLAAGSAQRAAPVAPPNVGDKVWRRMFKTFGNYNTFDSVRARVVYVGPKMIIMEDTTNELATTMDAEFQSVGAEFDRDMYGFLSNFGDPLAVDSLTDNNGRVVAMFTRRVNEYQLPSGGSLLGFVTLCDFFPQSDPDPNQACPVSNEGEYFYAIAPNPNGLRGKYDLGLWKRYARGTMIHEMKHVVMFATRLLLDASFTEETWLEEATAQMSTEIWARKIYGSFPSRADIKWADGPRCDYAQVSGTCADPVEAILHPFQFLYSHYSTSETKSILNNTDLVIYGSSWSFARWLTDTYDGGSESTFLQHLVQQKDDRGVTNVLNRTGRPWAELFGLFSMASTADNYPNGTVTDTRLRLPSWNSRDVFAQMSASLVFRNPDGTTTPAFPLSWPLRVRSPTFGTFSDVIRNVNQLPGGGWAAWDISGTQTSPQVLAIRSTTGGPAPAGIGMVVLRVQ